MKKIMKMRKMISDRLNFSGFPDTEGESIFPEQPDTLLFLQVYSDECQKLKEKHLNYDSTAYTMHCDGDVKTCLQKQFNIVYDIRRNTRYHKIDSNPQPSSSTGAKHSSTSSVSGSKKDVNAVNKNALLFRENNKVNLEEERVVVSEKDLKNDDVKNVGECGLKRKRDNCETITINNNTKKNPQEMLDVNESICNEVAPDSTTSTSGTCYIIILVCNTTCSHILSIFIIIIIHYWVV